MILDFSGTWQQEAYDLVAQICGGIVGQAQIEGYIDSRTYISLYLNIHKHGVSQNISNIDIFKFIKFTCELI